VYESRLEAWQGGFSVRRDWPDLTHEFVRFCRSRAEADRYVESDRAYWRRSPWRPTHTVAFISGRDFELHAHRHLCRAPDCPRAMAPSRQAG